MSYNFSDELKIKNIEEIALILLDFYLFHKRFKKYVHWNTLIFLNNITKISEHELSYLKLVMILDEKESQLFVNH